MILKRLLCAFLKNLFNSTFTNTNLCVKYRILNTVKENSLLYLEVRVQLQILTKDSELDVGRSPNPSNDCQDAVVIGKNEVSPLRQLALRIVQSLPKPISSDDVSSFPNDRDASPKSAEKLVRYGGCVVLISTYQKEKKQHLFDVMFNYDFDICFSFHRLTRMMNNRLSPKWRTRKGSYSLTDNVYVFKTK